MLSEGALPDPLQHHPHASVNVKLAVHSTAIFYKKVPYWKTQSPQMPWEKGGLWAEEADLLHVEAKQVEPSWKFSICSLWFFSYIYHLKINKASTKHKPHPTKPECSLSAWNIILRRKISRPTSDNTYIFQLPNRCVGCTTWRNISRGWQQLRAQIHVTFKLAPRSMLSVSDLWLTISNKHCCCLQRQLNP